MNKIKQKRMNYNTLAVEKTAEYYNYTSHYIRMCLRGDRTGVMSDNVIKKYREFVKRIEKAVEL